MNLYNVFNQILILFLILLVGIIAKKARAVGDNFDRNLVDFIMNIALPALIISSMNYKFSTDMLLKSGKLLFICVILYTLSIIIAFVVPKLLKAGEPEKNVYQFMMIFSNVGFMGYPVIDAIYGQQGVFYTAIYNLPFNLLLWTIGVIIMSSGKEGRRITLKSLVNPGMSAVLIGFIIFIFSIKIPGPIASTIEMIGSMTTPLSMLLVGFILADSSLKRAFSSPVVFLVSFIRLIAMPLMFYIMLKPFINDPMILGIPVVIAAMPAAANTAIFAGKYDGDVYTASQSIFISTLLSIITIPLIVYIMEAI